MGKGNKDKRETRLAMGFNPSSDSDEGSPRQLDGFEGVPDRSNSDVMQLNFQERDHEDLRVTTSPKLTKTLQMSEDSTNLSGSKNTKYKNVKDCFDPGYEASPSSSYLPEMSESCSTNYLVGSQANKGLKAML